jgi:oxygen-dependent protoporphyrinogen oxidase
VEQERVIVVGAGLAGLAVAARLLAAGRDVLVLEAARRAGGQIHTLREQPGLVVELGAEGFVARSQAVPALCGLLGIEGALVDQLTTDTYEMDGDGFVLLPPGEAARRLGFQVPEEELGRGIRSLALGMQQLIDALLERLGARVRLGVEVAAVQPDESGCSLQLASGSFEHASAVVLATPSARAARLLASLGLAETAVLAAAPVMSNVSVNLLYGRSSLGRCPAGSGVLFSERFASQGLRALSIVNHKFAGRAADDRALLRLFFRPRADEPESSDDRHFTGVASAAIAEVLATSSEPERSWVSRWPGALPVFTPAHRATVAALDAALQARGIHVCGSAFHGAGIDGAVKSAEIVAARLA